MGFDPKALAVAEWNEIKGSKMVKAVIATMIASLTSLVLEAMQGQIKSVTDLKVHVVIQLGGLAAIFARHTLAGIEAKLNFLGPDVAATAAKAAEDKALAILAIKHPEAAATLKAELNKPEVK